MSRGVTCKSVKIKKDEHGWQLTKTISTAISTAVQEIILIL